MYTYICLIFVYIIYIFANICKYLEVCDTFDFIFLEPSYSIPPNYIAVYLANHLHLQSAVYPYQEYVNMPGTFSLKSLYPDIIVLRYVTLSSPSFYIK